MNEDENEIMDLLHDMGCDNISVSHIIRLGRRKEMSTGTIDSSTSNNDIASPAAGEVELARKQQSRQLMLVIASEEQKEKMLKMTRWYGN